MIIDTYSNPTQPHIIPSIFSDSKLASLSQNTVTSWPIPPEAEKTNGVILLLGVLIYKPSSSKTHVSNMQIKDWVHYQKWQENLTPLCQYSTSQNCHPKNHSVRYLDKHRPEFYNEKSHCLMAATSTSCHTLVKSLEVRSLTSYCDVDGNPPFRHDSA